LGTQWTHGHVGWLAVLLSALLACGCGSDADGLTHELANPLVDDNRWSALHAACSKGDVARARELLNAGIDPNVVALAKDDLACHPLHLAAERGDVVLAQLLMEKGAKISAEKSTGATPLHSAVENGHRAMVVFLMGKGADPSSESFYVHSPMKLAQDMGRQDLVDALKR
jgi:ankyrin repeat protein